MRWCWRYVIVVVGGDVVLVVMVLVFGGVFVRAPVQSGGHARRDPVRLHLGARRWPFAGHGGGPFLRTDRVCFGALLCVRLFLPLSCCGYRYGRCRVGAVVCLRLSPSP